MMAEKMNEKIKYFLIIFGMLFILFAILIFRNYPLGVDSYDYLSLVFGKQDEVKGKGFLINWIFSQMHTDFLSWNLNVIIFLIAIFASICLIGYFLKFEYWFLIPFGLFISIFFPAMLLQFEPINIGLLFGFVGVGLFFVEKKKISITQIFLFLSGFLIWQGTALFFIPLAFLERQYIIFGFLTLLLGWSSIFANIFPNVLIQERIPFIGLIFLISLLFNYSSEKGLFQFKCHPDLKPFCLIFGFLGLLSAKFMLLAIPFFAINSVWNMNKEKILTYLFVSFIGFMAIVYFLLTSAMPTTMQIEAVKNVIDYSVDGNVQNDWDYGHWIKFFGGNPSARYGGIPENQLKNFACDSRPILTRFDLNSQFDLTQTYGGMKIYECKKFFGR